MHSRPSTPLCKTPSTNTEPSPRGTDHKILRSGPRPSSTSARTWPSAMPMRAAMFRSVGHRPAGDAHGMLVADTSLDQGGPFAGFAQRQLDVKSNESIERRDTHDPGNTDIDLPGARFGHQQSCVWAGCVQGEPRVPARCAEPYAVEEKAPHLWCGALYKRSR